MADNRRTILVWTILLLVAVGLRLATAVWYVQDPDSLRFALALHDFDVASLQPHFPGYPVFVAVAQMIFMVTSSTGLTFALVGGLSTFLLLYATVHLVRCRPDSPEGLFLTALVLFNPMIWVMGNRYMPDLLGAGVAILIVSLSVRNRLVGQREVILVAVLVGLLAGIRLSYLPLVLVPAIYAMWRSRRPILFTLAMSIAVAAWLVPMIIDTGLHELIEAARLQASGHFTEFGGTIDTVRNPDVRRIAVVKGILADGLGFYWSGRHQLTILVAVGCTLLFARGAWWLFGRETTGIVWTVLGVTVYLLWIVLFQNVVYQPRHVLPIIPLILCVVWAGGVALAKSGRVGIAIALATLTIYMGVGGYIGLQQLQPTAIAQVSDYLTEHCGDDDLVMSTPLVRMMLKSTGVEARWLDVMESSSEEPGHSIRQETSPRMLYIVGWFDHPLGWKCDSTVRFYHNPYVNAIWPEIPVAACSH